MTLNIYVKLQTPSIELKVSAKDSSGKTDSIIVGFKRYELSIAEKKIKELVSAWESSIKEDASDADKLTFEIFVRNEILYLKNLKLTLVDDKSVERELAISDTRTAKIYEGLWDTPDACLSVLVNLYLSSAPYRLSLLTALQKAFLNADFEAAEAKNS